MLIVLSGLPGTGKTTIGKALVTKRSAADVRVDEIEHALRQHSGFDEDVGAAGYVVAFAIASSNLKLGNMVVADSVNPVLESRKVGVMLCGPRRRHASLRSKLSVATKMSTGVGWRGVRQT